MRSRVVAQLERYRRPILYTLRLYLIVFCFPKTLRNLKATFFRGEMFRLFLFPKYFWDKPKLSVKTELVHPKRVHCFVRNDP